LVDTTPGGSVLGARSIAKGRNLISRVTPSGRVVGVLIATGLFLVAGVQGAAVLTESEGRPTPLESVPVAIHDRINTSGLKYEGEIYLPAKAVEQGFDLESKPTKNGGLRIANTLSAPLILKAHDPLGAWLAAQNTKVEAWDNVKMDRATGLPKTVYPWGTYTYPITVAHYGLEQYSKWVLTGSEDAREKAVLVGDWFVANQDKRGGWPVPFDYDFRKGVTSTLKAGWYSGMAQGMASDLLSKLFVKTKDARYRAAALKSLDILSTPVEQGGVQRKFEATYEWWEEYPTRNHPTFVLNGFIYSLIGVYDTSVLLNDLRAKMMYSRGLRSLTRMLNLYDLGSHTSYDLLHHSVPGTPPNIARWGYHNTHVTLVSAMNVMAHGRFKDIEKRWLGYARGISAPHN
jgi:heparosan-N-sulfate-glucuronate 5-epimerase